MMRSIRDYPIAQKLTWMNMLVSGIALLLACASFFTYDIVTYRQSIVRNLSVTADIIGSNSVSALLFNDARSAENTLSALQTAPRVVYAGIYTNDGKFFAGYWRNRSGQSLPLPPIPPGSTETYSFGNGEVGLARSISFQGNHTGTVYIRADLQNLYDRLTRYAFITIGVLLLSMLAALLVSRTAQNVISEPVVDLAETARTVSREKNYSLRASSSGGADEVGTLIRAFNDMLSQIQQRDTDLHKAHDQLEHRVKERTAELKSAEESLRALSRRLLQLRDEERRHIARELHDGSAQVVAALAMNLSMIEVESKNWSPKASRIVGDSIGLVQSILKELRTMSYLLHPPLLDDAGLDSAVRWFVEGFADRSKIPVDLEITADLGRLPRALELAVFRIVQECLTNIHRHSGSPNASIRIARQDGVLTLEVCDHGKGMPSRFSPDGAVRPGVGIQGMQERVRQLGGTLEIESDKGGTLIRAVMPIREAEIRGASAAAEGAF
jgi:signal transduction histidine kinase